MSIPKKWYIVHTKPLKEEGVFQLLVKGGYELFFPKIKSFFYTRKNGAGSVLDRIKPLFPSYLFIRLHIESFEDYRTIKYTRGVRKVVGDDDGPIPIQEEVVELIRSRVGAKGYIEQGAFLKTKDRVIVKRGVLKDLIGILEKPIDDEGRVEVLFKIVHHQMRAKVYCSDLERL